jgi:HSP20 family molecular chaperone IbpA
MFAEISERLYEEAPRTVSGANLAQTQDDICSNTREDSEWRYHMAQQWNWLDIPMRPALPPPPSTADMYEPAGGEEYVIEIHVPGVKPEDIVIEARPEGLRVSTNAPQDEKSAQDEKSGRKYILREQEIRRWSRLFEFPMEIDTDRVRAELENGILKIHAPKALSNPPKIIRVPIGESGQEGQIS